MRKSCPLNPAFENQNFEKITFTPPSVSIQRKNQLWGILDQEWGRECDFFENLVFECRIEWTRFYHAPLKPSEMDSTHRELFKKQKIIKIGSRKKKLQLFKVGDFSKFFESPGFSYSKTELLLQKLSQQTEIIVYPKIFCLIIRFQFLELSYNIWHAKSSSDLPYRICFEFFSYFFHDFC